MKETPYTTTILRRSLLPNNGADIIKGTHNGKVQHVSKNSDRRKDTWNEKYIASESKLLTILTQITFVYSMFAGAYIIYLYYLYYL